MCAPVQWLPTPPTTRRVRRFPAPPRCRRATPAHVAPAAAAAFTGFDYARASLECVPCEPSNTAAEAYRAGRAVPAGTRHVSAAVLAECTGVTSVTVPATTTFVSDVGRSAFASPVLRQIIFDPPVAADDMPDHHSYTARCLMNVNVWFSPGNPGTFGHADESPEGAVGYQYGTLQSFSGAPVVPNGVECVPCVTDASVGDLTVPWYVRRIPPYAFFDCSIPGTVRFGYHGSSSFYGVQQIAPHAFHLETRSPRCRGAAVDPGRDLQPRAQLWRPGHQGVFGDRIRVVSCGRSRHRAHQDEKSRRISKPGSDVVDGSARREDSGRFVLLDQSIRPSHNARGGAADRHGDGIGCCAGSHHDRAGQGAAETRSAVWRVRLRGDGPGALDEEYNPVATLPDARSQQCGPETRRIGPVTIPYYPLLLPPGVVPITINQSAAAYDPTESENCTLEFLVRVPPGAHRPGCDVCDASQCVPAAMDSVAAADFAARGGAGCRSGADARPPPPEAPSAARHQHGDGGCHCDRVGARGDLGGVVRGKSVEEAEGRRWK